MSHGERCLWLKKHVKFFVPHLTRADYYLLHALQAGYYKLYDKYHMWDFVKEQKEKGLIKHWGFSFHAGPDILDEILTHHLESIGRECVSVWKVIFSRRQNESKKQ